MRYAKNRGNRLKTVGLDRKMVKKYSILRKTHSKFETTKMVKNQNEKALFSSKAGFSRVGTAVFMKKND